RTSGHSIAMRFIVFIVFCLVVPRAARAEPVADVAAARALAARARAHLDLRQPEQAARLFDAAHGQEAHALWLLASGEAWLEALRPVLAGTRLEAALADPEPGPDVGLPEAARKHAAERLTMARSLLPLITQARDPETRASDALAAWNEAFAASNIGRC